MAGEGQGMRRACDHWHFAVEGESRRQSLARLLIALDELRARLSPRAYPNLEISDEGHLWFNVSCSGRTWEVFALPEGIDHLPRPALILSLPHRPGELGEDLAQLLATIGSAVEDAELLAAFAPRKESLDAYAQNRLPPLHLLTGAEAIKAASKEAKFFSYFGLLLPVVGLHVLAAESRIRALLSRLEEALPPGPAAAHNADEDEVPSLLRLIHERRSVRAFRPDPVPDEHLEQMLDAARHAPTAGNQQPWRFLVVRDRDNLARLRLALEAWLRQRIDAWEAAPEEKAARLEGVLAYLAGVLAAPLFVFILVDTSTHPELVAYDGALAAENLMLAARALDYGTCFQTTFFPEEVVCRHFGVPERFHLVCALPVGRPTEWPPAPPKRPLAELVCYESMGEEL